MHLLDTDTLTHLHAGHPNVIARLGRLDDPVVGTRTEELLAPLLIVPFDLAAAAQFDRLQVHRTYRAIGRADLLVASIALANQATLVTRNLRHFRQIPALTLANWVD